MNRTIKSNGIKLMKKLHFVLFALWLVGGLFVAEGAAQPNVQINPNNVQINPNILQRELNTRFISKFVGKLDARLNGKSVGYTFFVTYKKGIAQGGAGGDARRSPDANPRKMTVDDKYNIASVSKTITASAVLKILNDKNISVDTAVHTYLPSDWTFGDNFKTITFRELLTHRSGVRCAREVTYVELKQCAAGGVIATDKATQQYNNSNFGLFRIIIARMAYPGIRLPGKIMDDAGYSALYSGQYLNYVRTNLFAPAGLTGIDAKPVTSDPALSYQFPTPVRAGDSFGDTTEMSGSQGWNMSSKELALFLDTLVTSEKILPVAVLKQMKDDQLGWFRDSTTINGITSYEHTGHYPGMWNGGELNTGMFTFSNGLNVAVIINSQFGPGLSLPSEVKAALQETIK